MRPYYQDEPPTDDDEMRTQWVRVTNPEGVTFPAVLGRFHKAGVVSFFVRPEDAPPGEKPYERCEWTKQRPTLLGSDQTTRVYRVERTEAASACAMPTDSAHRCPRHACRGRVPHSRFVHWFGWWRP